MSGMDLNWIQMHLIWLEMIQNELKAFKTNQEIIINTHWLWIPIWNHSKCNKPRVYTTSRGGVLGRRLPAPAKGAGRRPFALLGDVSIRGSLRFTMFTNVHYVSLCLLCFTMFSTGQTRRLSGGCTPLDSLRSSHRGERSESDRVQPPNSQVSVWC